MLKTLAGIISDYAFLAQHQRLTDTALLPNNRNSHNPPIILLPGVFESWHIFDPLVVSLIDHGFPVYTPENLGRSTDRVEDLAQKVRYFIESNNLHNTVLVGHSKGGLVGKYAMVYDDPQQRIDKLFAIATPFTGARLKMFLAAGPLQELAVGSNLVTQLDKAVGANSKIINMKAAFDNHIWGKQPPLTGAENIIVPIVGHHRVLQHPLILQTILNELE